MARERERKKERKYSKGVEDLKKEGEGQKKMSKNAKKECRVLAKSNDTEKEQQIKQNNETEAKQKTGFFSIGLVQQYVSASHVHCYLVFSPMSFYVRVSEPSSGVTPSNQSW